MIRFFHTADIHFGVENYGRVDAVTGIHSRLLDFKESLSKCIDAAVREEIDFFLFSGDAYKTAHPTPTQQKLLMEEFFKLHKANIPVVIVVGNHDHPLSFGKANALDVFGHLPLNGFHVISKPDCINLQTKNGPVQIVGIPWPTRNNVAAKEEHRNKTAQEITSYLSEKVSEIISHFAQTINPNIPAVLAGHLTVSSGIFSGSEKRAVFGTDPLFLPSELALPQFDYVALGHLHRYQDLNSNGYPSVVYSGSIDRVDFGERKEVKGYCSVSIETGISPTAGLNQFSTRASHSFVQLETRPFVQIEVKLDDESSQTDQLIGVIQKTELKNAIVKLVYHIPQGKRDLVDLALVQKALEGAWHVVGIIPIHVPVQKIGRVQLTTAMKFDDLLSTYIDSKDELKPHKNILLSKIQELESCDQEEL